MQGMSQEALILPGIHTKFQADILHVNGGPGQEVPTLVVLRPSAGVVGQSLGLIMLGIEGEAEQKEVFVHPIGKTLMENSEIVLKAKKKNRKGTTGVEKR